MSPTYELGDANCRQLGCVPEPLGVPECHCLQEAWDHQPKWFWHKLNPSQYQDEVSDPPRGSARDIQIPIGVGHRGTSHPHWFNDPPSKWLGAHDAETQVWGTCSPCCDMVGTPQAGESRSSPGCPTHPRGVLLIPGVSRSCPG